MCSKLFKKLIALMLVCCSINAAAQGDFDVRIAASTAMAGQYCVVLQISNQSNADLEVGGGTFIFDYNDSALSFNSYSSSEYDENTLCGGSFNYNPHVVSSSTPGIVSTTLSPSGNPFISCVLVDCNWLDIAEVCFDIIDPTLSGDFTFSSNGGQNSLFESQNFTSPYLQGETFGLDEALDGSSSGGDCASVDVEITYAYDDNGVTATFCVVDGTDNCAPNNYTFSDPTGSLSAVSSDCSSLDLQVGDMFDVSVTATNGCQASVTGTAPPEDDCEGTPGGPVVEGADCDDGDPTTGGDVIDANCMCVGLLLDCLDVPGGTTLPGTPCDDNDLETGNDAYNAQCLCVGQIFDCTGVAGGPNLVGAPCDDGDPATIGDAYNGECECVGGIPDCLGVPGGAAIVGAFCDDGNPDTGFDTFDENCNCAGLPFDCEGVPGGPNVIGEPCDDEDIFTAGDVYNTVMDTVMLDDGTLEITEFCGCVGGPAVDCLGVLDGSTLPGTPCDDGNFFTVNDEYRFDCLCVGVFADCEGTPGGSVLPGTSCDDGDDDTINDMLQQDCTCLGVSIFDCPEQQVDFGASCDDGNEFTVNDIWNTACVCIGLTLDCENVVQGLALPGTPCDDNDIMTIDDVWLDDCTCLGVPEFDCFDIMADFGETCDDGDELTLDDIVQDDCTCAGTPLFDCLEAMANIGDSCDDGNSATGDDVWNDLCFCLGQPIDCEGNVGGSAVAGTTCDDGDPNTVNDSFNEFCNCVGATLDCEGAPGGPALPGTACNDGDSSTDNDVYGDDCVCAGEAQLECNYEVSDIDVVCDDDNDSYNVLVTLTTGVVGESFNFFDGDVGIGSATESNGVVTFMAGPFSNAGGYLVNIFSASDNCQETIAALVVECTTTPLTLIGFEGEAQDDQNLLTWTSASEVNLDRFEILRSLDGQNFTKLGQVVSVGNPTSMQHYNFVDQNAPRKTAFYKLRMLDIDGSLTFSNVVTIERESSIAINVYPVPVTDLLNVELSTAEPARAVVEVFDITGRRVLTNLVELEEGINTISVGVSDLAAGTYLLRVVDGRSRYGARFVK